MYDCNKYATKEKQLGTYSMIIKGRKITAYVPFGQNVEKYLRGLV